MENDKVVAAINELLAKMGIESPQVSVSELAGNTLFAISTKDSGILIGSGGETLSALNHIVKKAFEKEGEAPKFMLDVNGYHAKHIKTLEHQARMLAERARMFKYDVEMSPMSAYDRLIVHASLSDLPGIATESKGEGKVRHVVIKYLGDSSEKPAEVAPEAL
jgi:spoIIIJ-associated protein